MIDSETCCAPDCTDESMWICTVAVDGKVLDERLIDCTDEQIGSRAMRDASTAHIEIFQEAQATGHHSRMKVFCPDCGGGNMYDTDHGIITLPPRDKPQMLHLLTQATDDDRATGNRGPIILAKCGHDCVGTPITHERMKDGDFKHIPYCIPCFARETD